MAALTQYPALFDALRSETMTAYRTARHADCDWQTLDGQFQGLQATINRNLRRSENSGQNSAADQAARVDSIRSLILARDAFIAQTDNGRPKRIGAVPTSLAAKRMQLVYDEKMEAAYAAGAFGPALVLEGRPSFEPTQIHKPQRQHGKTVSLIGGGAR